MNIHFFSGGAGCGKTHRLMATLGELLVATPLEDGQQVLALTFMHGSRRRLDERLLSIRALARKYECVVLDSFALKIVRRWRSLLSSLEIAQPREDDFDAVCEAAATILAYDFVAKWVAATYPVIILDEAQDLNLTRLRIIQNLTPYVRLLVAADEFQCLNTELRPNPTVQWLDEVCQGVELVEPKRTNVAQLLNAASAVRQGRGPATDGAFKVFATANAGLAGSYIANAIAWSGGRRVALITPTANKFAVDVVNWVSAKTNKKGNGPYQIRWERSDDKAADDYIGQTKLNELVKVADVLEVVAAGGDARVLKDVRSWLEKQRRAKGRVEFLRQEVLDVIQQSFSNRKHGRMVDHSSHVAMTVHGAKNREFEQVVVLWPAATGGNAEQKRRLLYNAITRAKRQCMVLVQAAENLKLPPFV